MNVDLSQWTNQGLAVFLAVLAFLGGAWLIRRNLAKSDQERKEMLDRIVALEAKVDALQERRLEESKEMITLVHTFGRACLSALTQITSVIRYCQTGRHGVMPEVAMPDIDSDVFDISEAREAQCGGKSTQNRKAAK